MSNKNITTFYSKSDSLNLSSNKSSCKGVYYAHGELEHTLRSKSLHPHIVDIHSFKPGIQLVNVIHKDKTYSCLCFIWEMGANINAGICVLPNDKNGVSYAHQQLLNSFNSNNDTGNLFPSRLNIVGNFNRQYLTSFRNQEVNFE
jgi:hypothetical protein